MRSDSSAPLEMEILPASPRRPPLPGPLIVLANGMGLILQPDGTHALRHIDQGLNLGWMPVPELGGLLVSIRDARCHSEGIVTTLTRAGLRGLIEDLRDIDAQLEAM